MRRRLRKQRAPHPIQTADLDRCFEKLRDQVDRVVTCWSLLADVFSRAGRRAEIIGFDRFNGVFSVMKLTIASEITLFLRQLLDPPETMRRSNLNFKAMALRLGESDAAKLVESVDRLNERCPRLHDIRNIAIAHADFATAMAPDVPEIDAQQMHDAVLGVARILNELAAMIGQPAYDARRVLNAHYAETFLACLSIGMRKASANDWTEINYELSVLARDAPRGSALL